MEFDKIWHEYETKLQEGLDTKQREIDDLKKAISALEDEYGPALQVSALTSECACSSALRRGMSSTRVGVCVR